MIDAENTHKLVYEHLAKAEQATNYFGSALPENKDIPHIQLVVSRVDDYDFGWVFFYNSKEYLDTKDYRHALLGNAPIIFDRNDGQLCITGTSRPIGHYIEQHRKRVRTRV